MTIRDPYFISRIATSFAEGRVSERWAILTIMKFGNGFKDAQQWVNSARQPRAKGYGEDTVTNPIVFRKPMFENSTHRRSNR